MQEFDRKIWRCETKSLTYAKWMLGNRLRTSNLMECVAKRYFLQEHLVGAYAYENSFLRK